MEFKFLLAIFLFQAAFTKITAEPLDHERLASRFPFRFELEQIASKILLLEVEIEERTVELRNKDEYIGRMERIIEEKSGYITSLRSEIEFLQQKRSFAIKEDTAEEDIARKMQVDMEGNEIGFEGPTKNTLRHSEKIIHDLNLTLLSLQNVNNEQNIRIRRMELALQVMEEELTRKKPETGSISKDTVMVCEDRLPQLATIHFGYYQSLLANFLNEQGRPAMAATFQMAMKTKSQIMEWCESYIETIDTKWIPNLKEQWLAFTTYLEPHVPHVVFKVVEVYNSAAKEVKKCIQPLVKLVVEVTKPNLENALYFLMQYNGTIFHARQNFIGSVPLYHSQVQEMLKSNNFIKPFATMDLAWFAATALLALPLIFLFKLWSAITGMKSKKYNGSKNNRRGAKRSHL